MDFGGFRLSYDAKCTHLVRLGSTYTSFGLLASYFLELLGCSRATSRAPGLLASYFYSSRVVLVSSFLYFRSFWVDLLDPLLSQTILRRMGRKKNFHCDFFFFWPFWPGKWTVFLFYANIHKKFCRVLGGSGYSKKMKFFFFFPNQGLHSSAIRGCPN